MKHLRKNGFLINVESFAKKISDYIAVYDEANKSPTPENRAKRNSLYEEISKLKNDSKNYYENIFQEDIYKVIYFKYYESFKETLSIRLGLWLASDKFLYLFDVKDICTSGDYLHCI